MSIWNVISNFSQIYIATKDGRVVIRLDWEQIC
jgi:hypothetical protein